MRADILARALLRSEINLWSNWATLGRHMHDGYLCCCTGVRAGKRGAEGSLESPPRKLVTRSGKQYARAGDEGCDSMGLQLALERPNTVKTCNKHISLLLAHLVKKKPARFV